MSAGVQDKRPSSSYVKARSLTFVSQEGEAAKLSIVLQTGDHLWIEISPGQLALLNEEIAAHVARIVRAKA
jgi:hypothetical protein